ncbi:MAG: hypothetical protein Q8N98_03045 [bacterium]|nr:hypothetical protein [bacterium]
MTGEEKQKEIIELVKARLSIMPVDAVLSVGSDGEFNRDELIKEVENNTDMGKKIVEIQMQYLRLLKEGIFYANAPHHQAKV